MAVPKGKLKSSITERISVRMRAHSFRLYRPIPARIPGIEIAEKLFEFANESKKSLYLFGAKQEVLNNLYIVQNKG